MWLVLINDGTTSTQGFFIENLFKKLGDYEMFCRVLLKLEILSMKGLSTLRAK